MNDVGRKRSMRREDLYYWIFVAIFGVLWGLGTSVLAGALPPEPLTRSIAIGWFEVTVMLSTKLVLLRRFAVSHAITIAATLSIGTFSFGPPNPYKPLFLLAGLAFDAGSLFRTTSLRFRDLITGLLSYIVVAFGLFVVIFYLIDPTVVPVVVATLPVAAAVYATAGILVSIVLWKYVNPQSAPRVVIGIRNRTKPRVHE